MRSKTQIEVKENDRSPKVKDEEENLHQVEELSKESMVSSLSEDEVVVTAAQLEKSKKV